MTTTLSYSTTLVEHVCGACGIPFAMPKNYVHDRQEDHATWYCPNGHPRAFSGESKAERLARQLKWAEDTVAAERARADGAEASLRTTKGHVTRLRNRTIAGDCPLCGKHVYQLARHVARQHPDETPEAES